MIIARVGLNAEARDPFWKLFDVNPGLIIYLGAYQPIVELGAERRVQDYNNSKRWMSSIVYKEMRYVHDLNKDIEWFRNKFPGVTERVAVIDLSTEEPFKNSTQK